jgi:hypothetical protein
LADFSAFSRQTNLQTRSQQSIGQNDDYRAAIGSNVAESADSPKNDEKLALRGANLHRVSQPQRSVAQRRAASQKCLVRFEGHLGENAGGDGSTGKAMTPSGRSAATVQQRIAS